ncbi:hypothetical protein EGY31_34945 [Burkholderia multivorans]|uniref:hypothetical protein n=1 Tax=Burkholderia ubonensis TaxID=101571 RepID=UPI000F71083A|nr:hypothetical protein [Burkholderia ubonensis]AYZ68157.1 hypothetical protein EGY31_34945 [Burkholderia multivorans]VWB83241.1 hypothetical protein BUB20358_03934 [Burkholderia ubonensis]
MTTQKQIGPSFYDELVAYGGLIGAHFTWSSDGAIEFFSDTPTAVVAGVNAVYAAHNPATIPIELRVAQALAVGLTITSTSTPAINGTYAVDSLSQSDIVAIEASLNAGKGFPGGSSSTFSYPDMSGALHGFSEANFTNFAAAVRDYVYALKAAVPAKASMLPSAIVTIA